MILRSLYCISCIIVLKRKKIFALFKWVIEKLLSGVGSLKACCEARWVLLHLVELFFISKAFTLPDRVRIEKTDFFLFSFS